MKKLTLLFFSTLFISTSFLSAQNVDLKYYLPDIKYDKNIPTPESILGYQIGDWHISHDQLVQYMRQLAAASDRVTLTEYGRTHENRPLVYLTITSPRNHKNLSKIKAEHHKLTEPDKAESVNIAKSPAVLYQGFSIHGNEPSGGNAAPLVAYYLAAGKGKEVENILNDVVILLDPCYNPDGFNRFASWANTHKNKNLSSDPQDIEYNEPWPRGRTNHYWFDLNRDWLPVQHPESQGRISTFHQWKPNVLTDHHEMGSNATYFFMPGASTRVQPNTPKINQTLTGKIANYHAAALDEIGSLYYSGESFDDFYIGKGSTYPDVNGCVGILFEQASSRGHLQETVNGLLSFPFTIRNHVKTALSSLKATKELREELLNYQKEFYLSGVTDAEKDEVKAYVFAAPQDVSRVNHFIEVIRRHDIEVYELAKSITVNDQHFDKKEAFVIPLAQAQYRFIKAVFDTRTSFEDSIFYDVSAWSLQYAFNLDFEALNKKEFAKDLQGKAIKGLYPDKEMPETEYSDYAYLLEWTDFYAPKALNFILNKGLRAKVATESFSSNGQKYAAGTISIPAQNQSGKSADEVYKVIQAASKLSGLPFTDIDSGHTPTGIDLGSPNFKSLTKRKVLLLAGKGTSAYNVGAIWHLLDQRYDIVVSMINASEVNRKNLSKYTTIIMAQGDYGTITKSGVEKIKKWVNNGGTLIAIAGAVKWTIFNGISATKIKKDNSKKDTKRQAYASRWRTEGGSVIGGAIVAQKADLSHPLLFGYAKESLPTFRRGDVFFEPAKNPYATPLMYTDSPLLSGYVNEKNQTLMANSAGIVVSGKGSGKVIAIADNPTFRAFWYGTAKILANSIFFGDIIDFGSLER